MTIPQLAMAPAFSLPTTPSAAFAPTRTFSDTVQLGTFEPLGTYAPGAGTLTTGKGQAIQFLGIGVMMSSILAGAAMGSPWGPAVMIGGMFAGLALMAYGRDK